MKPMELDVVVHQDGETNSYWAEVAQLPGCFAAGRTRDELLVSLEEAIALYLEGEDEATVMSSDHIEGVERFRFSADRKLIPA